MQYHENVYFLLTLYRFYFSCLVICPFWQYSIFKACSEILNYKNICVYNMHFQTEWNKIESNDFFDCITVVNMHTGRRLVFSVILLHSKRTGTRLAISNLCIFTEILSSHYAGISNVKITVYFAFNKCAVINAVTKILFLKCCYHDGFVVKNWTIKYLYVAVVFARFVTTL